MVVTKARRVVGLISTLVALWAPNGLAATLAPDAVDIMYHSYEGGGMEINGPSVLVRKSIGPQVSVTGHYLVDSIIGASVDVIALASEYTEERTEMSAGIDFLHEKTILSAGYTNSSENDYEADTAYVSISQDFFGDLTNFTLAYARGWDQVMATGAPEVDEEVDRQNYKLAVSQVLTKNSLLGIDFDVITDEGFLENPYRRNRFADTTSPDDPRGFSWRVEQYPETRTSTALGLRWLYYLPYRASLKSEYRYYSDSWDIQAHTLGLEYAHPVEESWILEGRVRYYTQDQAEFYNDFFPDPDVAGLPNHFGRDKELSQYSGFTFGFGATYEIGQGVLPFVKRMQAGLLADYLIYNYDNFRDVNASGFAAGEEPLYELTAWVIRASLIIEY